MPDRIECILLVSVMAHPTARCVALTAHTSHIRTSTRHPVQEAARVRANPQNPKPQALDPRMPVADAADGQDLQRVIIPLATEPRHILVVVDRVGVVPTQRPEGRHASVPAVPARQDEAAGQNPVPAIGMVQDGQTEDARQWMPGSRQTHTS
jgi:hypothetical protein